MALKFKWVGRYDEGMRIFRLFRITTDGKWGPASDPATRPARKLSFAVRCFFTLFPLRIRLRESWGGRFG